MTALRARAIWPVLASGCALVLCCLGGAARAHGVDDADAAFIAQASGAHIVPFMYLGAKHMVTGIDHLLFLLGVVFFLRRPRDIALYVTLFAAGHSVTLLGAVLLHVQLNAWLIDALIGLSVAYKALDNLGGWRTLFGVAPDARVAVLLFGLCHGAGLATRLQQLHLSPQGLLPNLIAFHAGIELGQLAALTGMLAVLAWWRCSARFGAQAVLANGAMLCAGLVLAGYQISGFILQPGSMP